MTSVHPDSVRGPRLTDAQFRLLGDRAEAELGISMPESKRAMLETRLLRRIRELKLSSFADYCRLLERGRSAPELPHFLDLVTTNKTSFFRERVQLEALVERFVPELLQRAERAARPLRIWSAACSSGEEVWTLAMMLDDLLIRRRSEIPYLVVGSDISGRVLKAAISAKYREHDLADVPAAFVSRYFMRSKQPGVDVVRVVPELRARAGFVQQNLMANQYSLPGTFDVVLLRNALIYFPRELQERIVARTADKLTEGGLYVVSLTESLQGMSVPLRHESQSIYRRSAAP